MSTPITTENQEFIDRELARGSYDDQGQLLNDAVDLLERIDAGRRQLDAGEFTDYDDESLRARFDQVKQRAAATR